MHCSYSMSIFTMQAKRSKMAQGRGARVLFIVYVLAAVASASYMLPYAIGDSSESGTSGCDTSGSSFDSAEASSASVFHVVVGGYTKSKKMVHAALGGTTDGCFETPVAFVRYIDST